MNILFLDYVFLLRKKYSSVFVIGKIIPIIKFSGTINAETFSEAW